VTEIDLMSAEHSQRFTSQPTPHRLLLYLEWLLLVLAILGLILPFPLEPKPQFSALTLLTLIVFGLMGLRLPTQKLISKILYIASEFLIIMLLPMLNEQPRYSNYQSIAVRFM
jgi:hypothetical protein